MAPKRTYGTAVKHIKPSVWTEFVTLAAENDPVNLGQGFPDGSMPKFLATLLQEVSLKPELHQYTRDLGHPRLVKILAKLYSKLYGRNVDADEEILVTVGACLALDYCFRGWISKGDEVVLIEPCYDCYAPQVQMAGGTPVGYALRLLPNAKSSSDYVLDFETLDAKCNEKTKILVLTNPNNPTGKLFTMEELEIVAKVATKHDLIVVTDEVYEWHQMDKEMIRLASLPGMYDRTISIGSAGKAFSITGWKLGWAIGPAELLEPLKMIHQNCVFACSTPTQEAVARAFEIEYEMMAPGADKSESYLLTILPNELREKRDILYKMVKESGLEPLMPDAGYFMMVDFSKIDGPFRKSSDSSDPIDFRFARWLCKEKKLAAIPPSAFYFDEKPDDQLVRLCFMKKQETLEAAHEILKTIAKSE